MKKLEKLIGVTLATVCLAAVPASAATLNVVDGQLVGASDVDVDGTFYNVSFEDGTCAALLDGCDDASDFAFATLEQARLASQALLETVLIDGPLGNFDTEPSLTLGIDSTDGAAFYTPYALSAGNADASLAVNTINNASDGLEDFFIDPLDDLSTFGADTYAVWSVAVTPTDPTDPSTPATIPLPLGVLLLITGLGGIAVLRWRRT